MMVFSCSMSVRQRFDCNTFRPFLHGYTAIAINPSHLYERGWANVAHGHDPVCRYLLAAFHATFPRSRCWRIIKKKIKSKKYMGWCHGVTVCVCVCSRVCVCVCQHVSVRGWSKVTCALFPCAPYYDWRVWFLSTATISFLGCVVSSHSS